MCHQSYIIKSIYTNGPYILLAFAIILLLIVIITYINQYKRIRLLESQFKTIDGSCCCGVENFAQIEGGHGKYKVHEDLEDPKGAAETMDKLNIIAQTLIDHLNAKYKSDDVINFYIKPNYAQRVIYGIKSLNANYNSASLEENIPERSGGDTSYVIDKGSVFAMCLRDPKNNNKLDDKMNSLTFVLVHELTHLFTKTYGHDMLFWNNFNFLLTEASMIGIYKPVNYKTTGSPYCGIVISYSPLFDPNLDSYFKQNAL